MRRLTVFFVAVTLAAGLAVAPAAAAERPRAPRPVQSFCRSTEQFLRFFRNAPDPKKFATTRGKAVLRSLHATAPRAMDAPTATIVDSFGYLSRHGRGTLTKARDRRNGDALFRTAVYTASHCKQHLIQVFATGEVQRRIEQAEATTTTTTRAS